MDQITLMGGGKKLCHGKQRDSSENHLEKYFEESFCMKHLLDFFLIIVMCQKLLDRHENSSEGMRFSNGCEMARGRGAKNSRRQPIAKYLKGGALGDLILSRPRPEIVNRGSRQPPHTHEELSP